MTDFNATKAFLINSIDDSRDLLIHTTRKLVQAASPNPPGDVSVAAAAAIELIKENIPSADISLHETSLDIVNVVAAVKGSQPGKTLVFSGHLDTYPTGDDTQWTVPTFAGSVSDDGSRLYGRGAADMKGGIAASLVAIRAMAQQKDAWEGHIVLALAGDEETMGSFGTKWLLDNIDMVQNADAAIVGDAGSPLIVRTGEKGLVWLEIRAIGKAAHGAHVHRGVNAIERLIGAIECIKDLEKLNIQGPDEVVQVIEHATPVSEKFAGPGEADVLRRITVNLGTICGDTSMNLIPDSAQSKLDIRLPYGITTDELLGLVRDRLDPLQGISFYVTQRYDPTWTSQSEDIVKFALSAARDVIGPEAAINMRVGASDARLYRQKGIPTVVVGLTPYNMGGPDEYCVTEELIQVAQIHALTAFQFLGREE